MRYKLTVRALLLMASALSIYLAVITLSGAAVAGCGPDSGCDRVLQSRWSKWFGIPVSVFSVVVYGALFAATLRFRRKKDPASERAGWHIILPLTVLAVLAAVYFIALQVAGLRQVCPLCMTVHIAGLVASALLLWQVPIRRAPDKPWQAEKLVFVSRRAAARMALIAVAAFGLFAGGQALQKPKTYSFQTYDGRFQFDLNDVPLIGNPARTNAIISLFDYTCHHCRTMHWHLMEAFPRVSNHLAIISLPNPLDSACNPNIRQTHKLHQNACNYARLGLAVWRANRKMHHEFDDWMFKPEHPPSFAEAQQYAANLVGSNQLARAMEDPWVGQTLQKGINIYSTNYLHLKNGNMPQLMMGTNLMGGTFGSPDELIKAVGRHLGIAPSS